MQAIVSAPLIRVKCDRCNGTGRIGVYAHVAGGECFACCGRGTVLERIADPIAAVDVSDCRTVDDVVAKRLTTFRSRFPGVELDEIDREFIAAGGSFAVVVREYAF